jgi:zinc protease
LYFVQYACDPANVSRVHDIVVHELQAMATAPASDNELHRAKAFLLRQIPLDEASLQSIAQGILQRSALHLPLDEPTIAAHHYLSLNAAQVEAAFAKWVRPESLVRISEGPAPQ